MFRSSRARWVLALLSTVLALAGAEMLLGGPLRPELLDDRDEAWQ